LQHQDFRTLACEAARGAFIRHALEPMAIQGRPTLVLFHADEGQTMTIHPTAAASIAAPASTPKPAAKPAAVSEEVREQQTGTEEPGESLGINFSAKA
jgi:hypothetical protein